MDTTHIQTIQPIPWIDDCELELINGAYYLKKDRTTDEDLLTGETIVTGDFFASLDQSFVRIPGNTMNERYPDQIGYITCEQGWIVDVHVNEKPINARNCGISTVFTTLCMIDPELSKVTDSRLQKEITNVKVVETIKKGCSNFVGLRMRADPLTGAYAYFSAARNNGYNKFLIRTDSRKNKYKWMDVADAREWYDKDTGNIDNMEGYDKNWWFCTEIEGQIPPLRTSPECKCAPCFIM